MKLESPASSFHFILELSCLNILYSSAALTKINNLLSILTLKKKHEKNQKKSLAPFE